MTNLHQENLIQETVERLLKEAYSNDHAVALAQHILAEVKKQRRLRPKGVA